MGVDSWIGVGWCGQLDTILHLRHYIYVTTAMVILFYYTLYTSQDPSHSAPHLMGQLVAWSSTTCITVEGFSSREGMSEEMVHPLISIRKVFLPWLFSALKVTDGFDGIPLRKKYFDKTNGRARMEDTCMLMMVSRTKRTLLPDRLNAAPSLLNSFSERIEKLSSASVTRSEYTWGVLQHENAQFLYRGVWKKHKAPSR